MQVFPGYGGVDLEFQSGIFNQLDTPQGAFEGAFNLSEAIMGFGARAIDADADALNTGVDQLPGNLFSYQGAVQGHNHSQAECCAMAGDVEDV
jgi:hypothetical protein